MSARDEVARLLVEHRDYGEGPEDGSEDCRCGWWGTSHAAHLADVLDKASLLRQPRPKVAEGMTGREMLDGLVAASRHELERMRRER